MLVSFVYFDACRLFAFVLLLARSDRSKELEILLLRHELSILRRQARRPQLVGSDRLMLAALSRVMPRRSWQAFLVTPGDAAALAPADRRAPLDLSPRAARSFAALLIFGRPQLEHVLRVYIRHFTRQRPHRALDPGPPERGNGTDPSPTAAIHPLRVRRRDLLGGLLHEY